MYSFCAYTAVIFVYMYTYVRIGVYGHISGLFIHADKYILHTHSHKVSVVVCVCVMCSYQV